jgi:oligopeptide/dipeptide ABC transporter ATP-binding protein
VTIQAQILDLVGELQDQLGMAVLLITHDLGVVAQHADEVTVMYAGRIVERAKPDALFARPLHPYTVGLLNSMPGMADTRRRLEAIPGIVPSPLRWPSGCRFHARCRHAMDDCSMVEPQLLEVEPGHWVSCIREAPASGMGTGRLHGIPRDS